MSGLDLALTNAISGINVNQQSLAAASGNITNANTAGYSRKSIQTSTTVLQGVGVGANPVLQRIVDDFLAQAQRKQTTSTAKAEIVSDYMERIQVYLGSTDSSQNTTIMTALDSFFGAVQNVSTSPDQPYFRNQAVKSAESLATVISNLSLNLQSTRYQADLDIATAVSNANNALDHLAAINTALHEAKISGTPQEELFDKRDTELKELTQYLDVGVTYGDDGTVTLFNQSAELLSQTRLYHLSYTAAGSIEAFKGDKNLGKLTVVPIDRQGNQIPGRSTDLTSGGKSADNTTTIKDGKILGLMQIRDTDIPKMLAQLDSLADGLREEVNKISNNGVGYPPPQTLTGTRQIAASRPINFEGSVRIAALSADGTPVASAYSNDEAGLFRPLTLDFSKIYGPTGFGKPTNADIIKEVNQYYGPTSNRASMGPLADTKLVAISDNTTGPFEFDLQFDNPSANPLTITIVSVDGVASGAGITANPGEITRTGPGGLTFTKAGAGPYSIPVVIQVTDPETGITYSDTITYTVPAAASGARGDRYPVASLGGTAIPPEQNAAIVSPTTNNRIATAQIVDANGNIVTDPDQLGYLQIIGNNGARIAIDEMTSKEVGSTNVLDTRGTLKGFSAYYQLNDFFAQNTGTTLGSSASNLKINQKLIDDPNLMSIAQLSRSNQSTVSGASPLYTYQIGVASNQAAEALVNLRSTSINFKAAGTLPAFTNHAMAYASEIYAFSGSLSNSAESNLTQQNILQKSYDDRASNVSGVNLDEELANTILYQNAYSASARIITVVSTLFDVLLRIRQ
jgi:flagellar hook-associated protein 1 FlgK